MINKSMALDVRSKNDLYSGLDNPDPRRSGSKVPLPLGRAIVKHNRAEDADMKVENKERVLKASVQLSDVESFGYDSKGKSLQVPNGSTHYAAVIRTDNSVTQEKCPPPKDSTGNTFSDAKDIIDIVEDIKDFLGLGKANKDGFNLVKTGDKIIIKGARTETAGNLGIKGTRYSIDNLDKYPNLDKLVDPITATKSSLRNKPSLTEPLINLVENISNKQPGTKVVADAAVDVTNEKIASATTAATTAAIIGSALLGPRNLIINDPSLYTKAALGGMTAGMIVYDVVDSVSTKAKGAVKAGLDKLVNLTTKTNDMPVRTGPFTDDLPDNKQPKNNTPVQNNSPANSTAVDSKATPPTNDKPVKTGPFDADLPDNKQPKNNTPAQNNTPAKSNAADSKATPPANDKPVKTGPFDADLPDNKQPKIDPPAVSNKQEKEDKTEKKDKEDKKSKPAESKKSTPSRRTGPQLD